jgi:hypothetical protein
VSETFTVKVQDTHGVSGTQSLTITVVAAPNITTTTAASATDNQTGYSQPLTVTGGTTPYTWSISSGTLPTGLSITSSTGTISGTVGSAAVSETFTVQATDADGVSDTQVLTITVVAAPNITTTTAATATDTQTGYSQPLTVTGGTAPLTWSISSGTLPSGLTISSSTGTISGTVGAGATTQTFTVQATDAHSVSDTQVLTITVAAVPSITTTTLASATPTGTYSQPLAVTGGTAPLTWSISSGILPTGLTISSSTGTISGTVGAGAVSETFTVKVQDTHGISGTKSLTITVVAAPSVTNSSLAGATQTGTYSQTLTRAGGTTPYGLWSVSVGSLPTGLSLNTTSGTISGPVGASATSQTFTVAFTDADGVAATKSLTITVNAPPTVSTTTLAAATDTQTGYAQTLGTLGGTSPFASWTVTSGTLPAGLSLNPLSGVISGTVGSSAVSETFTVSVTDADGVAATKSLSITVNVVPNITTTTAATATDTQTGYSQPLTVTGGTTPFIWAISSGTLPSGLTISSSTGTISGTLGSTATSQTFTVQVTDTNAVIDTQVLTITVAAVPSITTSSLPNGVNNSAYSQPLVVTGGTAPLTWSISSGILPAGLTISSSTGTISGTVGAGAVSETFTVKVQDTHGVVATKSLTITVT